MFIYCLAALLGSNFQVGMGVTILFTIIYLGHDIFSGTREQLSEYTRSERTAREIKGLNYQILFSTFRVNPVKTMLKSEPPKQDPEDFTTALVTCGI